eukprot:m.112101 g.112101  ORF g.112101 m.112101 type:complete len:308 (+) comp21404_c0_seq2:812-1735(+)
MVDPTDTAGNGGITDARSDTTTPPPPSLASSTGWSLTWIVGEQSSPSTRTTPNPNLTAAASVLSTPPPPPGFRDDPIALSVGVAPIERSSFPVARRKLSLSSPGRRPVSLAAHALANLDWPPPSTATTNPTNVTPNARAEAVFSITEPPKNAVQQGTAFSVTRRTEHVTPEATLHTSSSTEVPPWPTRDTKMRISPPSAALYETAAKQSEQMDMLFERASNAHRRARASIATTLSSLARERALLLDEHFGADVPCTQHGTPSVESTDVMVVRRPRKVLPRLPRVTSVRWRPSQFSRSFDGRPMAIVR